MSSAPADSAPGTPPLSALLVDDERGVLNAMARALRRYGIQAICAESGEEALGLLERERPQVVLSDHRMPGMDGVTLLTRVRERWPTVQRVLITGFADMDAIERAINQAGIYRFVNKPWDDLSLLSTVRSAAEQWHAVEENQRLFAALEGHNRRLEEAVAARTRELQEAQAREREALRQVALADRLAAIGQLAGGVAHELNNPLSGVLAFAQLLLRGQGEGEGAAPAGGVAVAEDEAQEFLREIESGALRCKKIVEHLLRFSRQAQRDEVGPINLNTLVREALPLIEHQYALRGAVLRCGLEPALPDVLGSGARLQQVLMNLLSNALDATVSAAGRRGGPGRIDILTTTLEGWVVLAVRDQGDGVAERHLPQIFSPFFTTKPEGHGAGLGLSVAYGIVAEHGGTITTHNATDGQGGAEFVVTLPAWPPREAP